MRTMGPVYGHQWRHLMLLMIIAILIIVVGVDQIAYIEQLKILRLERRDVLL